MFLYACIFYEVVEGSFSLLLFFFLRGTLNIGRVTVVTIISINLILVPFVFFRKNPRLAAVLLDSAFDCSSICERLISAEIV